jgi:tungstate transport system ATP-binding protein
VTAFRIENLTKVFDGRTVLDVDNLELETGRITGLLGPNGSGKTTLLNILAFLTEPTSGNVWYDSRAVDYSSSILMDFRREVVQVFQTPIMFTTTVYKNVEFGLKVRKTPKAERRKIIEEALDLVGLRGFAEARADKLSGGETQRASIARALACSPKVLLMDEPTANVDVENRIAIENIVRDVNAEKKLTVVLTTHDTLQAARLADRMVFLFEGRPASSAYENIFSGRVVEESGRRYCLVQDRVRLPLNGSEAGPEGGSVKVALDPWKLALDRRETAESGELEGKLIQVTHEGDRVRLLVDVGLPLSVLMNPEEFDSAVFRPGCRIVAVCGPNAVKKV